MVGIFQLILFIIFTLYVLVRSISYGLYEIEQEKNKVGGIAVILFTLAVVIFCNVVMFIC